MFNPSRDQVRQFFIDTWAKHKAKQVLTPLEDIALNWIEQHPEYHEVLGQSESMTREFNVEEGKTNPFLHLSMHLSISEQCSIDQPRGIRQAVELISHKKQSLHEAHHATMECLGRMIFESQRAGKMPDGNVYIECVQRHATQD